MNKMNNTEKLIEKIDKYITLMRYDYTSKEKLMRLNILEDYYDTKEMLASEEVFRTNIECAEQLSKGSKLKLPLKVRGIFLKEGRPAAKFYTADELEKAADNPVNMNFPLMVDHRDKEADKVIGIVNKIEYDPELLGLRWWGHINSEVHARNVVDGAIKEVSVTVFSAAHRDEDLGLVGKDLTFKELSLVMTGAVDGNMIEVDE